MYNQVQSRAVGRSENPGGLIVIQGFLKKVLLLFVTKSGGTEEIIPPPLKKKRGVQWSPTFSDGPAWQCILLSLEERVSKRKGETLNHGLLIDF